MNAGEQHKVMPVMVSSHHTNFNRQYNKTALK